MSNNWRAPKERKSICHSSRQGSSSGSQQRNSFKKYGTIPRLQKSAPSQTQRGSKFSFLGLNTDNIIARGESSIQQQLYHPQLQAQSHCLNISNSLNNTSFWAQSNACGEIQQQHGSLVEMLGAKVLQDPIIGNTNYMPGLMLNSGNHHSQSDYKLDLNVAYGKTYSGNIMISVADVENGAISGLGAANANFQQYIGESNMSNPSSAAATSYESDIEGSDSNKRNCDAYLDSSNANYLFQNLGPSSADLSNEHDGSEFNQVYSDDQVTPTSNVE
ncbi:hypothetical protein HAX54_018065 [Datura stramonium]|uniref:Uncharacterized protein n=1 Tax=Datura stramonium TaxID=4076 RepID=A0ABS8S0Z3_DATST|nr:hypothetical protein [Datura stramonium]